MTKWIAAAVQMDSQDNLEQNLEAAAYYVKEAAQRGAQLVVFPECMNYLGRGIADHAESLPGGRTYQVMAQLAKDYGLWLDEDGQLIDLE